MIPPDGGPAWVRQTELEDWPTAPYRSDELRYELALPLAWSDDPQVSDLSTHSEEWFAEGLLVQYMETADPAADIAGWVEVAISVAGAPAVAVALAAAPELLEWSEVAGADELRDRLGADELRAFEGLAWADGMRRLYTLLARRGRQAWHFGLALDTSCRLGAPAELVAANDHARAAAMLGALHLG